MSATIFPPSPVGSECLEDKVKIKMSQSEERGEEWIVLLQFFDLHSSYFNCFVKFLSKVTCTVTSCFTLVKKFFISRRRYQLECTVKPFRYHESINKFIIRSTKTRP